MQIDLAELYQLIVKRQFKYVIEEIEPLVSEETVSQDFVLYLGTAYLLNDQLDDAFSLWMMASLGSESDSAWNARLFEFILDLFLKLRTENSQDIAAKLYSCLINIDSDIVDLYLEQEIALEGLKLLLLDADIADIELALAVASKKVRCESQASPDQLLLEVISSTLEQNILHGESLEFIRACILQMDEVSLLSQTILKESLRIAHSLRYPKISAQIVESYLLADEDNVEMLGHLASFYQNSNDYELGIKAAEKRLHLVENLPDQIFSMHLLLRGLLGAGGHWSKANQTYEKYAQLLERLNIKDLLNLNPTYTLRLFTSCYYLAYFQDTKRTRFLLNHVNHVCQTSVLSYTKEINLMYKKINTNRTLNRDDSRKLRIGYLSHCMSQHSVGWLARWLLQYHDRSKFELYGYFVNDLPYDELNQWYKMQFDHHCCWETDYNRNSRDFAQRINSDEIDILIDLNSITLDVTCEILAMKPTPIQATWLGWDAIGMSAIDYFIADPYVLPENAQDYYVEKIWRLPETYLAVEGFEVAVPTLKREDLNISDEAVIFLTAQRGYKRHRDTAVLQMQIIAGTPNSYLCIKGFSDDQSIQNFFYEIADEVGVDRDRLRFLESDPSEAVHRANLRIADVVLDTYPYNGATTTMETLWMEVPIVTRVGEQFAARNSYTMMMNAGITEGLARSAEEYVEWGVRLGTDAKLRQDVCWKLRESKKTAPLWNAKQFTRHMEKAYQQMWKTYVDSLQVSTNVEITSEA
jgi:predicted O-linked N-acetylglucosamine transferase (SPINDLY family)